MTEIDKLLDEAVRRSAGRPPSDLSTAPSRHLAVLTCMDSRIDAFELLGLELGEAHVIRNAGGLASDDAIRSLALSQHMLGTRGIAVIQHTRCGLMATSDEEFAARLREHSGEAPDWSAGCFDDLDESVRRTVRKLRDCPFLLERERVRGFAFDVDSRELREIGV